MLNTNYIKRGFGSRFYQREVTFIIGLAATLFCMVSLFSYNPYDSSWSFAKSDMVQTTNACGFFGAHIAALFFYLFGSVAFFTLFPCVFTLYLWGNSIPLRRELDRYAAYFLLLVASGALCTAYSLSLWGAPTPGGLVGSLVYAVLHPWFDTWGTVLFLSTLLLISIIIATQLSFISLFYGVVRSVPYVVAAMKKLTLVWRAILSILLPGYHAMRYVVIWCTKKMILFFRAIAGFFGVLSQPIEYDAPDYDYVESHSAPDAVWHKTAVVVEAAAPVVVEKQPCVSEPLVRDNNSADTYQLPNRSIFIGVKGETQDAQIMKELEEQARVLEEKLRCFGVAGSVSSIKSGPVVTLFEYKPEIDSKISKIIALEDDLALALKALSIRIIAPIPGRSVVGFEVSNARRKNVLLAQVVQSAEYADFSGELPLILGQDTIGNNVVVDLARMPHLLVAGSTGSGKSVALNTMLVSLLCARTPNDLRLILIDPKRLEFVPYADIAHLLFPIVTVPKDAVPVLQWVVSEMELRYRQMAERGARSLADYNKMVEQYEKKALIVVIIDELSDLMMTAGKEIETIIVRITQMARAAGIHLIVATQRPSVDVITGLIKVNFPSRISFRVTSKVDSRTILDCSGADKLLGRGDMLFLDSIDSRLKRVHGAYVSDSEIHTVMESIRAQSPTQYLDPKVKMVVEEADSEVDDQLYEQVLLFLQEIDEISISLLQRKFRIGYNRSARIIDLLEARGLVMPSVGSKMRKVIR